MYDKKELVLDRQPESVNVLQEQWNYWCGQ